MISAQNKKAEIMLAPQTASAAGTAKGYLDTLGWDYATIDVTLGTYASDATQLGALSVTEATNSAAASSIVALLGTTATEVTSGTNGFIIPKGKTTDGQIVRMSVDLTQRERYLAVNVTAGATAHSLGVNATLSRGREEPGPDDGSIALRVLA